LFTGTDEGDYLIISLADVAAVELPARPRGLARFDATPPPGGQ
jgi:hypothetical protein